MPIDFEQWVSDARQTWRSSPKRALFEAGYYAYCGVWLTVTSRRRLQLGTNVYDRDWDLLILLDACRIDALRHVASDFDVLPAASDIDSMWSLGSASAEWLSKTFTDDYTDEIAETIYLSANPYSVKIFDNGFCAPPNAAPFGSPKRNTVKSSDFKQIYNLTRTHCDERYNVVLPVDLTDAAIQVGRNTDAHRYIVHYMQPHVPYLARAIADDRDMTAAERDAFDRLGSNGLDYTTIKRWYIETLSYTLEWVRRLVENFDAEKVVVSADHGELFGEWHMNSHLTGLPHPKLKRVPWARTTATDTESYHPEPVVDIDDEGTDVVADDVVEQQLEALGYH